MGKAAWRLLAVCVLTASASAATASPARADCVELDVRIEWADGSTTSTPWPQGHCLYWTPWGEAAHPYYHDWKPAPFPYRDVLVEGSVPSPL